MYFIIEEGQFNGGNFEKAKLMIDLASSVGADAIEFQLAIAEEFYIKSSPGYLVYKQREFSESQLESLVQYTHEKGLEFVATCLGHSLVKMMNNFGADRFNINASDINNFFILDEVIQTGKPFFISSPLATIEEISAVINRIKEQKSNSNFVLLHGQHTMASGGGSVNIADTSIGAISTLSKMFNCQVGFIDHTNSVCMPSIAVASGATVITKHLSPAPSILKGPDWEVCLDPIQMKNAIDNAKQISISYGIKDKCLAEGEDLDRTKMRRSIVSNRDISKGEILSINDITLKRPASGLMAEFIPTIVGKKMLIDVQKDTLLEKTMFENE